MSNQTHALRAEYFREKRSYKSVIRNKKGQFQKSLNEDLMYLCKYNPNQFWKKLNLYRNRKENIPESITMDQWVHHFRNLGQTSKTVSDPLPYHSPYHPDLDVLRKMKNGKTPGIDGIPVEIYKMLPRSIWKILIDIWNKILASGQMPQEWCKGIIRGDASLVDNYRGITLLPTITRIFFTVLSQRILDWAEQNNVIPIEQFGFRPGHRASDAIY